MWVSAFPGVVRFADCSAEPWANGGGSTRVIAVYPDGEKPAVFDWRLSVATVDSGDFSRYPGVDRVIVLVEGPTMTLTIDGVRHDRDPLRPTSFAGESVVTCKVAQRSLDFNVMTRRGVCTADVSIPEGSEHVGAPLDCWTFIVAVAGAVTVRSDDGRIGTLERCDTVLLAASADVCPESGGRAAVVRVRYAVGRCPRPPGRTC